MIVTGNDATTHPAMIRPQLTISPYFQLEIATVAVISFMLVVMIIAYRYSFHDIVNAKVAVTAIPGRAIGTTICRRLCSLVQPSISAASSSA